ncbi:MAG: ATP-grasp domain-containing protein [Polyangia bacterium]
MPDDPDGPNSHPNDRNPPFAEQRILVLHNADFGEQPDGDESYESRADVANQAHDVARALVTHGHFVDVVGIDRDELPSLMERLRTDPPDLVFNLVESLAMQDENCVAATAILELFGIPFTGSGTLAMSLSCDKQRSKHLLRGDGIPTPRAAVVEPQFRSRISDLNAVAAVGYPAIVKLLSEHGSQGLSFDSVVYDEESLIRQLRVMRDYFPGRRILVEQYIDGRELNVGLLGDRLLPVCEIDLSAIPTGKPRIVTYTGKWRPESEEYRMMPSSKVAVGLSAALTERIQQVAQRSFSALGVTDYGRVDIRLSQDGIPYVLEVNPNCDISDGAGLSRAALAAGIPYDALIEQVAYSARQRFSGGITPPTEKKRATGS